MNSKSYPSFLSEAGRQSWKGSNQALVELKEHLVQELNKLIAKAEKLDQFDCPHLTEKDFFTRGERFRLRQIIKLFED